MWSGDSRDADVDGRHRTRASLIEGRWATCPRNKSKERSLIIARTIFSFGAILYEMLSGNRALQGERWLPRDHGGDHGRGGRAGAEAVEHRDQRRLAHSRSHRQSIAWRRTGATTVCQTAKDVAPRFAPLREQSSSPSVVGRDDVSSARRHRARKSKVLVAVATAVGGGVLVVVVPFSCAGRTGAGRRRRQARGGPAVREPGGSRG